LILLAVLVLLVLIFRAFAPRYQQHFGHHHQAWRSGPRTCFV